MSPPSDASAWAVFTDPRAFVLPGRSPWRATTIASFSRYMRSSMMDAMAEDYIRTARAKGAGNRRVLYGHALRNALIPILTLLGLSLPAIVSGALIVENVFNYPGMGLLTVQSAFNDDIPVVLGHHAGDHRGHGDRLTAGRHPLRGGRSPHPAGWGADVDDPEDGPVLTRSSTTSRPRRPLPIGHGRVHPADSWSEPDASVPEGGEAPSTGGVLRQMARVFAREQAGRGGTGRDRLLPAVLLRRSPRVPDQPDQHPAGAAELHPERPTGQRQSTGHRRVRLRHPRSADVRRSGLPHRRASLSALVATVFGTLYGAVSGFFGGWFDSLLMRIVDVLLSIPVLFLLIALVTIYHQSEVLLIVVIAFVELADPGPAHPRGDPVAAEP